MPGRRRPDDFSLLRKSQAPRFTGLGAEAKTGSGSAETENGRGGMPLPPPRVQCRFAFGEVRCGIYPRKKKLFFAGPGAEAKTGSGSAETENGRGGMPLPPPRVQCRFAFGEVRCGIYPRKKKLFSPGRAQSRGLSDRIEEREATARTSRFFVSVPAADAACGARSGRAASAAGGCGSTARRAALRKSADA